MSIQKTIRVLGRFEENVLGLGVLALALMAFVEVVGRYVFSHSFTWFEEVSRYGAVLFTFMGASLGVKYGMHFSMDFFITKAGKRTSQGMLLAGCLLSMTVLCVVAYLGWGHCVKLARFGVTSSAMRMPMWWAYLPIPLFGALMVLRLLFQAVGHVKGIVTGKPLVLPKPNRQEENKEDSG